MKLPQRILMLAVAVFSKYALAETKNQEAICKMTECRISYEVYARLSPESYYKGTWRLIPYILENSGRILIRESLSFEVILSKDKSVTLRKVAEAGPETLDVRLYQPGEAAADTMTIAMIRNKSPYHLRYKGSIFPAAANRLVPTSVCGLVAGESVSETWPYAVLAFTFGDFTLTTKEDAPACRV